MSAHPPIAELQQFALGDSIPINGDGTSRVVRHLMTGCPQCRKQVEEVKRLLGPQRSVIPTPSNFDYADVFSRAEESMDLILREGTISLESRVVDLLTCTSGCGKDREPGRPVSPPFLVKWFIHQSHQLRYRDPAKMLRYAALARAGAEACSAAQVGSGGRLASLRSRAWSALGNALRVNGDCRRAEECFGTAYGHYFSSTGDLEIQAELLQMIGSFQIHQGNFSDAIEVLREAGEIYEDLGQKSKFGSVLIQEAITLIEVGDTEQAVHKLGTSLPLIDPEEDSYLLIAVRHNLVRCYADLGQVKQAFGLLAEVKKDQRSRDGSLLSLRTTWQEGGLFHEIGELKMAARLLTRARRGDIYLRQNRLSELRRILGETAPLFAALRARREFFAMLLQLGEAAGIEVDFAAS
jgi:tetratricopeptide (TPR) repeat protein